MHFSAAKSISWQRANRDFMFQAIVCGLMASSFHAPECFAGEQDVQFNFRRIDGTNSAGALNEWTKDWSIGVAGMKGMRLNAQQWVTLGRVGQSMPAYPWDYEHVILVNGDRYRGHILGTKNGRLRLKLAAGNAEALEIPLSSVNLIWLRTPEGEEDSATGRWRRATHARPRDKAWLVNGDEIEGTFQSLDAKTLRMETSRKPVTLPRERLAAVGLSAERAMPWRLKPPYGRLVLEDGSRMTIKKANLGSDLKLNVTTLFDQDLVLDLKSLAAAYLFSSSIDYVSDLKPSHYEFTSFLGSTSWPLAKDAAVDNHELLVGAATFDKGLGMHGKSQVTYDLAGRYRFFEAWVALDAKSGNKGSARISVKRDGKLCSLDGPTERQATAEPFFIHIDVGTTQSLTLVVDFGNKGSVAGCVNWVDARLIRGENGQGDRK